MSFLKKYQSFLILPTGFILGFLGILFITNQTQSTTPSLSETEAGFDSIEDLWLSDFERMAKKYENWQRPEGPLKVALQAGHWKREEAPDEFPNLANNTGAIAGGWEEYEVNLLIAETAKPLLEEKGIEVDIIPATIPPDYWADAFIAIHADGNLNTEKSGYKATGPYRELTGKADALSLIMEEEYAKLTNLRKDDNITRNMRGYYAFNWRRYEHSLHPMTTAIILETGFLTNPQDRALLTKEPEKPAQAIANTIFRFFEINN